MNEGIYLGIDISSRYTVLSIYNLNMAEPTTISTVVGEENYSIPTVLAKRLGMTQWFFGDEALRMGRLKEAIIVDELFNLALRDGNVVIDSENFVARDLLVIYFKKLFSLSGTLSVIDNIEKLILCVPQVTLEVMETSNYIASKLGIDQNKVMLIDRNECFYYYALSQKPELFLYNVALFDYSGSNMVSCTLNRNQTTRPQLVTLDVINHGEITENKDE